MTCQMTHIFQELLHYATIHMIRSSLLRSSQDIAPNIKKKKKEIYTLCLVGRGKTHETDKYKVYN
jgi:hypothetical protein